MLNNIAGTPQYQLHCTALHCSDQFCLPLQRVSPLLAVPWLDAGCIHIHVPSIGRHEGVSTHFGCKMAISDRATPSLGRVWPMLGNCSAILLGRRMPDASFGTSKAKPVVACDLCLSS